MSDFPDYTYELKFFDRIKMIHDTKTSNIIYRNLKLIESCAKEYEMIQENKNIFQLSKEALNKLKENYHIFSFGNRLKEDDYIYAIEGLIAIGLGPKEDYIPMIDKLEDTEEDINEELQKLVDELSFDLEEDTTNDEKELDELNLEILKISEVAEIREKLLELGMSLDYVNSFSILKI